MDLDDRITIATPEGVELSLQLAGLASRFIAGVTDLIIQELAIVVLALVTGVVAGGDRLNLVAFVIGQFALSFFYPIAFEVLAAGRTPGKRWSHLRVIRDDGSPVDLPASAIRNLMRLLDGATLLYLPTVICIIATRHNQRPGDLAGGTLVIREAPAVAPRPAAVATSGELPSWDVSAITPQELGAVRQFLDRRETLETGARRELAMRLAAGLGAKVAGAELRGDPEQFLERLAALKSRS